MNLRNLIVVFLELVLQLASVKLAVASACLDDLGLLLQTEVGPGEARTHVLLEQREDLVVGDGTWVGEVVDAGLLVLCEKDGGWEQVVEDSVGVGDINDASVLADLRDKVAAVQVVADGHSQSQGEDVRVVLHDLDHCQLMGLVSKDIFVY